MGDVAVDVALDQRVRHSEGPIWDAPTSRLWWVDIIGQRVHRTDPSTGTDCSWSVDGQPGGVLIDADGTAIVGMPDGLAPLDRERGTTTTVVRVEADRPGNRLNDMKADSTGRTWVGSMAYDRTPDAAGLYRVDGASWRRWSHR